MPSKYDGPTDNKFDGASNPSHLGEEYDMEMALEPNKFPREGYEDGDAMELTLGNEPRIKVNYGRR